MGGTWGHWVQLNTRGCRNSMNAPLAGGKRSKLVGWAHRPMTMGSSACCSRWGARSRWC